MKRIVLALLSTAALVGCSSPPPADQSPAPPATPVAASPTPVAAGAPDRETAVKLLQSVSQQLEGGKYAEAAPHFKAPAGANAAQIESALKGVVEKREISSTGVDILAKDGKWGKLAEVFGAERASGWAERNGVSVDQCYGLGLDPAEVGFYWDGSQLLIIRLDDVGKLADR